MSKQFFQILWLLAALLVSPVNAEPLVRLHSGYYYIDGPSASVLAAQIDQRGPAGPDGRRFAAKTKWDVQWKFKHRQEGVTCSMKGAAVAIGIAQTLPKWRGEARGPASLRAHWKQFLAALQRHEDRHKEHGLRAGKEIEAAFAAVKPAGNCEDLQNAANAIAKQIIGRYQMMDEDYDRRTRHDQSEGAALL